MAISKKSLLTILSSLVILGCVVEFIVNGEYITLFLALVIIVFVVKPEPVIVLLLSQAYCLAMLTLSYSYITIPICIVISSLSTIFYVLHAKTSDPRQTIFNIILVLIPIYIIQPKSVIISLSSIFSLSSLIIMEQLKINRSRVSILLSNPTIYLEDNASIIIEIACPGIFEYSVIIDDKAYEHGKTKDKVLVNVKVKASRLGVHKKYVRVVVYGNHRLAKVQHGPFIVEYTVVPRFIELYRRAERIIREYRRYLSAPIILKSPALIFEMSGEVGNGTLSPGLSLEYPIIDIYSKDARKYIDRAGPGGAGDEYQDRRDRLEAQLIMDHGQVTRRKDQKSFELRFQWRTPIELLHKIIQESRSLLGEYVGLREFQPGDLLKLVNWKKSMRRAEEYDLVIKIFSASDIEKSAKKSRHIIIADLVATSSRELDLLLQTLYSHILSSVKERKQPELISEYYVYIVTPRGITYFLTGKALDVLLGLNHVIIGEKINALYDYNSWDRTSSPISQEPVGILQDLYSYYEAYGNAIVKDLKSKGVERGTIVLIYSKALSFKYYVVSYILSKHGYIPTLPTKEDHSNH